MEFIKISFFQLHSKTNSEGQAPVYCRISTSDQVPIKVSTGIFLTTDDWDKGIVKRRHPEASKLNKRIFDIKSKFNRIFDELSKKHDNVSLKLIMQHYRGKHITEAQTLMHLYDNFILDIEQRKGSDYQEGTIKHYKTNRRKLERFLKIQYQQDDIPIDQLNFEFIKKFEIFLKGQYGNKVNTINKETKRLKRVI